MNWESHSWPTRIEWNDRTFWTLLKLGFDIQKWEFTNVTAAKKCGDLTSKKVDSLHWKRYASKNVMGIGMKSIEIYEGCIILYTQSFRISWWTWKFVAGMCPASFIVLGFELFGGQGVKSFWTLHRSVELLTWFTKFTLHGSWCSIGKNAFHELLSTKTGYVLVGAPTKMWPVGTKPEKNWAFSLHQSSWSPKKKMEI
jgi:hypothetical protein